MASTISPNTNTHTPTPDSPITIPPARPRSRGSRASLLLRKATSFVSSGVRSPSPPPFDLTALRVDIDAGAAEASPKVNVNANEGEGAYPTPPPSTTRSNFGFVLPEIDVGSLEGGSGNSFSFWALEDTTVPPAHSSTAAAVAAPLGSIDFALGSPPPSLNLVLPCSPLDATNAFSDASFFADFARVNLEQGVEHTHTASTLR